MIRVFILVTLFAISMEAQNVVRVSGGAIFNRPLFWDNDNLVLDTICWDELDSALTANSGNNRKGPYGHGEGYASMGKVVYEVKGLSAISAAIVKDLGYPLFMLTQWMAFPDGDIKIAAPGMDNEYKTRRMRTDYLWETLDSYDAENPVQLRSDYRITLRMGNEGEIIFDGKEILTNGLSQIKTTAGLVISYNNATSHENVLLKRKIWSVYILADRKKRVSGIISEIEKMMDRLKLDMSYKIPEFKEVL